MGADLRSLISEGRRLIEEATKGPYTVRFGEMSGYDCMSSAYIIDPVDAVLDCASAEGHEPCVYGEVPSIAANAHLLAFAASHLPALLDVAEAAELFRVLGEKWLDMPEGQAETDRAWTEMDAARSDLFAALAKLKEVRP